MTAEPDGQPLLHPDAVFCQFFGWSRSGTTLVGSLLNAHPAVLIGQEADASLLVARGAGRDEVLVEIDRRDREFAALGRQWNGYDYTVGGGSSTTLQHPRRGEPLRVVGDKKAAGTVEVEAVSPGTLALLQQTMGLPLRLVCVTRNPCDTIATLSGNLHTDTPDWFAKRDDPVEDAVDWYLLLASLAQRIVDSGVAPVLLTSLESVVAAPAEEMRRILAFLGIADPSPEYLAECAAVVAPRRRRPSADLHLSEDSLGRLDRAVRSLPILQRYGGLGEGLC